MLEYDALVLLFAVARLGQLADEALDLGAIMPVSTPAIKRP